MSDHESLTLKAYREVRTSILSGGLGPGERVRIADLCEATHVSIPAIREALSKLTAEGLIVAEPRRSFKVAQVSRQELLDITTVRIAVESMCIQRSIANSSVEWETRIVAAHHALMRTPEIDLARPHGLTAEWAEAHALFHYAILSGCDSQWLLGLAKRLHGLSERYRQLSARLTLRAREKRDVKTEHRQLMQACLDRNEKKATELLKQHLERTTASIVRAFDFNDQIKRAKVSNKSR